MQATSKNDQARTLPSLFISLVIHAALIFLIPFVGAPQLGHPDAAGGPLKVTMIMPVTPSEISSIVDTRIPVQSASTKPPVVTETKPPASSNQVQPSKVLTTSNNVAPTKISPEKVTDVSPEPAHTSPSESSESNNGNALGKSGPPEPPYGDKMLNLNLLPTPRFPKDGHTLTGTTTFTLIVTVSAEGVWENAIKIQPVKPHYLDSWVVNNSKSLPYEKLGEPYEVTVGITLNPYTRAVIWDIPKERVRLLGL